MNIQPPFSFSRDRLSALTDQPHLQVPFLTSIALSMIGDSLSYAGISELVYYRPPQLEWIIDFGDGEQTLVLDIIADI